MARWQEYGGSFLGFTEEITQQWINKGFNKESCQKWLSIGVKFEEYEFAAFLEKQGYTAEWCSKRCDMKKLQEEYINDWSWKSIHPDFTPELREEWEDWGFDYHETKKWIDKDLRPENDAAFAYLLSFLKRDQKSEEKEYDIQNYLDKEYPPEKRDEVIKINIYDRNLSGSLIIEDWVSLETIKCAFNQLTSLRLCKLPKLKKIYCSNNKINHVVIKNCSEISHLSIYENCLTSLDFLKELNPTKLIYLQLAGNKFSSQDLTKFSRFVNLKELLIGNNHFRGSLEPLKNCTGLIFLDIHNTNIDSGLEYLPEMPETSLGEIVLSRSEEEEIFKELKNCRKKNLDIWSYFSLQSWRQNQPFFRQIKEALEKLGYSKLNEINKDVLFNVKSGVFEFKGELQPLTYLLQVINKVLFEESEKRIKELISFTKRQKEKIINAYLCFASESEKELLQELVIVHLEYVKFKKQSLYSSDYDDKCDEYEDQCKTIKEKLRKKLTKEDMNRVRRILTDCEELVTWELELETKLNSKQLLEEQKQIPSLITNYNNNKVRLLEYDKQLTSINNQVKPILKRLIGKGGYGEVYYGEWKL